MVCFIASLCRCEFVVINSGPIARYDILVQRKTVEQITKIYSTL